MKNAHIYILFVFCISAPLYANSGIRFQDLLNSAIENNHQLKIRKNNIEIFSIQKNSKFRELYMPNLNWSLLAVDENIKGGPVTNQHAISETPLTYASELALSYNVFNGFTDFYDYKSANTGHGLQRIKESKELQDIIFNLKTLYFNLSFEQNKIKILNDQLASAKTLKKAATIRYNKGLIPKVDLERSKIEYLDDSDQLIIQKEKVKDVQLELGKIIQDDKEINGDIIDLPYLDLEKKLKSELIRIKRIGETVAANNYYQEYLTAGVDLKTLKNESEIAEYSAKSIKGGYFPKLNLKLAHRYEFENDYTATKDDYYTFTATLTVPLISNFSVQADYGQQKLNALNSQYKYKENMIQSKKEINQICQRLVSLYASFEVGKEKVSLRNKVFNSTLRRFNRGGINIQDLIIDKLALQSESFKLATTINELRRLYLKLQRVTGKLNSAGA